MYRLLLLGLLGADLEAVPPRVVKASGLARELAEEPVASDIIFETKAVPNGPVIKVMNDFIFCRYLLKCYYHLYI